MDCSKIRRMLSAYCDAELPTERRAAVRRHLQSCEECRTVRDGYKNLALLTVKWTDAEPPKSLWSALAPKLEAACATVADRAGSGDQRRGQSFLYPSQLGGTARPAPSAGLSARRTFKPVIEGLEDRHTLSNLLGGWGMAVTPGPFSSAAATLHVDADWQGSFSTATSSTGALCAPAGVGASASFAW